MPIIIPHNHTRCVICQQPFFNDQPLQFEMLDTGAVRAEIVATQRTQGYDEVMQGGLVAALHDTAMLHCLFGQGIKAMTVKLETRYHFPVVLEKLLVIDAALLKSKHGVYFLESQVSIDGVICSSAKSQFMSIA